MEIRLGYVQQFEDGYSTFLDKVITEKEHADYLKAIREIQNYETLKRLFHITILNSNEFIKFIESEKQNLLEFLSIGSDNSYYYNHHLNLNRILLNYLASFRSLTDHIETIIKKKYGPKAIEATKYKEITSFLFDTYFAYRFLYKLRNYAQHCGLPIENFQISASKIDENKFKPEYKIEFDTKDLMANFDSWGKVKEDLIKVECISIFPLLEEIAIATTQLWKRSILIFENDIRTAINFLLNEAGHLRINSAKVCIFTNIIVDKNNQLKYFSTRDIPFDIIEEITGEQSSIFK